MGHVVRRSNHATTFQKRFLRHLETRAQRSIVDKIARSSSGVGVLCNFVISISCSIRVPDGKHANVSSIGMYSTQLAGMQKCSKDNWNFIQFTVIRASIFELDNMQNENSHFLGRGYPLMGLHSLTPLSNDFSTFSALSANCHAHTSHKRNF